MINQEFPGFGRRCALAVAHPGHELKVLGWMAKTRPIVSVLTDGSGRDAASRLRSTHGLILDAGATTGSLFGPYRDKDIYQHVLNVDVDLFLNIAEALAQDWVRNEVECVVGDADEGTIMAHDLWRGVVNCAIRIASHSSGARIENFSFELESSPQSELAHGHSGQPAIELDESAWNKKIIAMEGYRELHKEVQDAFFRYGKSAFKYESFLKQNPESLPVNGVPEWERHGERQVESGIYRHVVRYRQHLLPILAALEQRSLNERRVSA